MLEILTWKEARGEVKKANFKLADAIDACNFKEEIKFCKIEYPFGAPVFDKGILFVPNKNRQFVPISDPAIPDQYREYLGYDSVPFGVVLKNSISNALITEGEFTAFDGFYPGQIFGLRELFDSNYYLLNQEYWSLYAGARAIFSTTEISSQGKYRVIKSKFNLKSRSPECLKDHFFLFRELINHPHFSCDWTTTLLFFSKTIADKLIEKNVWPALQTFLLKQVWERASGWRFEVVSRGVGNRIVSLLKPGGFTNFGYQAKLLKHIIKISLGYMPCFVSDDQDEIMAPLSLLKEVLIDEYKVDFCPTIMVPGYISKERYHSGYYSINEPFFIENALVANKGEDTHKITRGVQDIYKFIKNGVLNGQTHVGNNTTQNLFKKMNPRFFCSSFDRSGSLLLSDSLPEEDPSLIRFPSKYRDGSLPFDSNSSFFKSVIKVDAGDPVLGKNC
ncbi:MAG: hypothetical protein ACD_21C00158G0003 [uncultured bacterium]|nr:MAG: hypothetical protein ACD_21C00158G0003 [uncultured bacterium]